MPRGPAQPELSRRVSVVNEDCLPRDAGQHRVEFAEQDFDVVTLVERGDYHRQLRSERCKALRLIGRLQHWDLPSSRQR